MTNAELCRVNGWKVGDVLEGDEGYGPTRIVLTAIGEDLVLARTLAQDGTIVDCREIPWSLKYRDWRKCNMGGRQ